jgi:hypothetical protein
MACLRHDLKLHERMLMLEWRLKLKPKLLVGEE